MWYPMTLTQSCRHHTANTVHFPAKKFVQYTVHTYYENEGLKS